MSLFERFGQKQLNLFEFQVTEVRSTNRGGYEEFSKFRNFADIEFSQKCVEIEFRSWFFDGKLN